MSLELLGSIALPEHRRPGGFDHAAVHRASGKLYVAHTANDAVDVIDCAADRYLYSIPNLTGAAGALVSDEHDLVFTSNRGENTVSIFASADPDRMARVPVGVRPNGLAYAPRHYRLLVANVGDPAIPNSTTVTLVDVQSAERLVEVAVPGRTRWAVYDAGRDVFYVNIAEPALILTVAPDGHSATAFTVPVSGPHGLDLDAQADRLYCACDGRRLLALDAASGRSLAEAELSGVPDVLFFNAVRGCVYVAAGDPGVLDVFAAGSLQRLATVTTGPGAHTFGFDPQRNKLYVFLPQTQEALVYADGAA